MRVEVDGKDITGTLSYISISASFDDVFSTVSIVGAVLLSECSLKLEGGVSYDLILWSSQRDQASYNMTFISKLQYKWLMSSVKPITGDHSFDTICTRIGVPFVALSPTNTKYYEMPHMQFYDFLSWMSDRVSCERAWLSTFHFDGIIGVDTATLLSAKAPELLNTPTYMIENMGSTSDLYVYARAEGSLVQGFVDKDEEILPFDKVLGGDLGQTDISYEFVTVSDLSWVSPNISKQRYLMNIDTAVRVGTYSDISLFTLGSLFTDSKGYVYFVNSTISNAGGQKACLCYLKKS